MLQRLLAIFLMGGGLYGLFNGLAWWLSILLIILGAGVFGGANHGVWFYFDMSGDNDHDSWGDD